MIEVLIADDHPIVRHGLRSALSDTPDIHVRDEASDGPEVLEKVRIQDFDVILLDLAMPTMNGFDVLKEIMLEKPRSKVLILSTYPEKQYAVRCLKAGALGYLTKESAATELLEAIRRTSQGR
ncbi:MAG TPA: response regulator transcription factor, partial [Bacteroidota bacterium]|nr:response regulator transcription factor [Bacteroidota bacterium]